MGTLLISKIREEYPARTSTSPQGMSQLESLQQVASLGLFPNHIQDTVHEFSSLGVAPLGPVITSSGLTKHEVVWSEQLTVRARPDTVRGPWLQVNQDGPWDILSTSCLVVVNINSLKLEIRLALIRPSGIDTVLVANDLPKLRTNLVTALSSLYVNDFPHCNYKI